MDHYLKFEDEAAMLAGLAEILIDGVVPAYHNGAAVDVVGRIVATPAELDAEGSVVSETTFADGWHVNWRGELPEALQPFVIDAPDTPARRWA